MVKVQNIMIHGHCSLITCISTLIYCLFQIVVGLLFFLIAMINVNDEDSHASAKILNNIILVMIIILTFVFTIFTNVIQVIVFIITLINAFINGFGIKHTDTAVAATMGNRNIR